MEQFEIEFFETDSGDCPVTEFLNGTEIKMKAKILRMIELLEKTETRCVCNIANLLKTEYLRFAQLWAATLQEYYIFS
ncbi:MAG: hypothetical protein SOW78_08255 [Clostridia bacterium]|nr:hypothetical protein [Clostridia bacterium]